MEIRSIDEKEITLLEVLVKTSYQTQVTHPSNKELDRPVGFGSGFISTHLDKIYFVTVDHVIHPEDYETGTEVRNWIDYTLSIFNNVNPADYFLSTIITPLGGFYYLNRFDLNKPEEAYELVDIAVCLMKPINFKYPFLTDEVIFTGEKIPAGEEKWTIKSETFVKPSTDEYYLVYGKVNTKLDGIQLKSEPTLKENLKFVKKSGDYFLFNTESKITNINDWRGLSGSPVISTKGECVGVFCSGNEDSHAVWVMPIDKVKMLMEIIIQQEKLEKK
ncbi:MAG: hypothetical protein PSV35_04965 [bacterium]|nr:hypothetical protein [bacterium]